MSQPVIVELSDDAYSALQLCASEAQQSPAELAAATLEQRFGTQARSPVLSTSETEKSRKEMNGHAIHRVKSFQSVSAYILRVQFVDQTEQVINFEPVLGGELYRPLRDLDLFNQVQIDPDVHTLVWPNGADFDPATLHD